MKRTIHKDWQYIKFCLYGFLKNQRFFEPFIMLIFLREKGLDYTAIGSLYAIRFILRSALEIPSGMIADALGRRGTMLFAYGAYMASFVAYYLAPDFIWLIVPTISFSIGDAFRTGTHKAMIFEYLRHHGWEDQKVNYYGHTRAWSQTGSAISSIIAASLVIFSGSYNVIFLFSLIPYSMGFILLASYPKFLEGKSTLTSNKKGTFKDLTDILSKSVREFRNRNNVRTIINVASFSVCIMQQRITYKLLSARLFLPYPVWINSVLILTKRKSCGSGSCTSYCIFSRQVHREMPIAYHPFLALNQFF